MRPYDRGSPVTIKAQFKQQIPYGVDSYYDPTSPVPTISVYDAEGTKVVDDVLMDKSDVGKYYYVVQTTTSWPVGYSKAVVTSGDGTYSDVEIGSRVFELV